MFHASSGTGKAWAGATSSGKGESFGSVGPWVRLQGLTPALMKADVVALWLAESGPRGDACLLMNITIKTALRGGEKGDWLRWRTTARDTLSRTCSGVSCSHGMAVGDGENGAP